MSNFDLVINPGTGNQLEMNLGSSKQDLNITMQQFSPTPISLSPTVPGPRGEQGVKGENGKEVLLRISGGYIQWQHEDDESWENLIAVSDLVGQKGEDGEAATISVGSVSTGNAGSSASVENVGTSNSAILNFSIPRGASGADGDAATISIGTVSTGAPGSSVVITNSGTSSAAVFDFTIPAGSNGSDGIDGSDGLSSTVSVGTVSTGNPGTSATVVNSGTSSAAIFDFTIPRGADGANGSNGVGVPTGGTANQVLQKTDSSNYNTQWHTLSKSDIGLGNVSNSDTTTTSNISDSLNKRFVTDAHLTLLGNTSGTNTGDQDLSGLVQKTTTINTKNLSSNITLTQDDVGDGTTYKRYSTTEQSKLSGIASGAEVNVNADWDATSGDAQILHKPTLGTAAAKDIPSSGNASTTQVVMGNDTRIITDLPGKVTANTAITGATKTKITYDSKGLVTAGADATTADIASSTDKRYVTDAQLVVIGNTSGTNTGDQTLPTDATISTSDVTTNNASTSKHGWLIKATAPASGYINVVGIANGETAYSNKALFDSTVPSTQAYGDSASAGSATVAARRDHKHAMPASTKDTTAISGILKGNGTSISAASAGTDYVAPGGALGTPSSGTLTNCTFPTLNQDTSGTAAKANALMSATTTVDVSSATAPTVGQVLTATSSTAATWQTPSGGGSGTSVEIVRW